MSFGDIYRILIGYDNCGNVCGRANVFNVVDDSGCRGIDMRNQSYLRVQSWSSNEHEYVQVNRICVDNCNKQTEM